MVPSCPRSTVASPCKIVLVEDAALVMNPGQRQQAAAKAFMHVYRTPGHPTPESIATDLSGLADVISETNFEQARGGASPAWYQAQIRYLKHARVRPAGPSRRLRKPRDVPAGPRNATPPPATKIDESKNGDEASTSSIGGNIF